MIALLVLAAAAAAPQPGEVKTFKDWTVGCDNGRVCQAVGLLPEDEVEGATITVQRGPAADSVPQIMMTSDVAAAALSIDGARSVYRLQPVDGGFELAPGDAMDFMRTISKSNQLALIDASGKTLTTISLAGASAALRYIDDRQKRAGTVTALVARGPAKAVPPPPALPAIVSPPVTAAPPAQFRAADVRKYNADDGCGVDASGFKPEAFRLDATHTLILVPAICGNGAYNYFTTALIAPNAGRPLSRARFDAPSSMGLEGTGNEPDLVNAGYDPKTRRLSTYAKGRGIGDCGIAQQFAWDGTRFRLVEQSQMDECRGSMDYITTWRATVR